jgi:hypothetical protein
MDETSYIPEWDHENQRFTTPSRCPYPDCASPVDPVHATEPTLGWCAVCNRPFEAIPFRPDPHAAPIDLHRRPASAYSTYTGQLLTSYSVLDWGEAGGEPGRSYCLDDARGAVFGRPSSRRIVRLVEDWAQHSILNSRGDDDDFVSSVSVVRGRVVAVTARGWIGIFDATSGEPATERPLEWPTGSTHPADPDKAVRYPPAFRGTQMVLVAPHEAQFRDLRPFLFPTRGSTAGPHRMVVPGEGCQFLGVPLGVDGLKRPTFCLLEGGERSATIEAAQLRFFDETGEDIGRCPAPGIVRAPLFDRRLERVVWVDGQGRLSSLAVGQIAAGGKLSPATTDLPDSILQVEVNFRPTFAVARNNQGRSEVWLTTTLPQGGVELHRGLLDDVLRSVPRSAPWRWQSQNLSGIGEVTGIAVGSGSVHANNATSQLLAVATDRQVLSLDRANVAGSGRMAMRGPESVGMPGSYDVPVLSSAGVVARLQGSVCLDSQGLGWSDETFQTKVPIPGRYQRAQGLAMFGRRVYAGEAMGVRSYRIDVQEPEESQ